MVGGEEKVTATVILKGTNQFAVIDIPQDALKDIQKEEEVVDVGETERMEEFWKSVTVGYEGTENLKAGKAHKITLKPNDPEEKGSAIIHILDGKGDPARIEVVAEEGNAVIEFDMLEVNKDIPADKFVPQTAGMTPISQKDLTTALMMQLMTAMMQQGSQQ